MTMNSQDRAEQHNHQIRLRDDSDYRATYIQTVATARVQEDGDCYPFHPDNLSEAFSQMPDATVQNLAKLFQANDHNEVLRALRLAIQDYWEDAAHRLTERDVDNG